MLGSYDALDLGVEPADELACLKRVDGLPAQELLPAGEVRHVGPVADAVDLRWSAVHGLDGDLGAADCQEGGRAADVEAVQGAKPPVPALGQVGDTSEAGEEVFVCERFERLARVAVVAEEARLVGGRRWESDQGRQIRLGSPDLGRNPAGSIAV